MKGSYIALLSHLVVNVHVQAYSIYACYNYVAAKVGILPKQEFAARTRNSRFGSQTWNAWDDSSTALDKVSIEWLCNSCSECQPDWLFSFVQLVPFFQLYS